MDNIQTSIIGNVHLLPIRAIQFMKFNSDGVSYLYNLGTYNIEAESSFSYEPIKKYTDSGDFKVLGYKFKSTIYIATNTDLNVFAGLLNTYFQDDFDVQIAFGNKRLFSETTITLPKLINSTSEASIYLSHNNCKISHSFIPDQVELRVRGKLEVEGFLKNLYYS